MCKSRIIQTDLTIPLTSPAPEPTNLQNSDDMHRKDNYALGDTEKKQYVKVEPFVDASITVHEVGRTVNSCWDPKCGYSYLVRYKNCFVEEREWTSWIEGCESKVVDHYELKFKASVHQR